MVTVRPQTVAALTGIANRAVPGVPIRTALPRVVIWASPTVTEPRLAMFEPKFYMLLQGRKRLVVGGGTVEFGPGDCAVASVGLPFSTQVIEASRDAPYIGFELGLDADVIAALDDHRWSPEQTVVASFATAPLNEDVMEAVDRLVRLLDRPDDIPALGEQAERELCYRLLQGPMRDTLRQTVQNGTRTAQIRRAIGWIRQNACAPMRVADLADRAGMSVTSFHRHFKAATACGPLAYQRYLRLLEARRQIASGENGVTGAAFATGYASASQFSREYKQLFGVPPIEARRGAACFPSSSRLRSRRDGSATDAAGAPSPIAGTLQT